MYPTKLEEDYIARNLLDTKEKLPKEVVHMGYQQMSLFDECFSNGLPGRDSEKRKGRLGESHGDPTGRDCLGCNDTGHEWD